ncbi:hypothetical protein CBR_g3458 [Chara braunii]|uniref:SAP domain-containing protein n=1 Tax=Chara braunii TaxID=69332 RepID=A0A388JQY0_CHABU|nr:hypothetical protein CBR_g3458 [Chara braunii]|eukprot:GBG60214.1 hypothetical protein CBR_g3458 [Chara braunii]
MGLVNLKEVRGVGILESAISVGKGVTSFASVPSIGKPVLMVFPSYPLPTNHLLIVEDASRRSWSAHGGIARGEVDDTNALMREYLVQNVADKKAKREKDEEVQKKRKEEAALSEKKRKKLMKQEERFRMEEERDARLLRIIRGEMRKDSEDNYSRSNTCRKGKMKSTELSESTSEEKERLRKFLALCGDIDHDDTSDEELKLLLRRTAKLVINEKRKRGPEVNIENSPPMVTPEKKASKRPLEETKTKIDKLRNTKIILKDLGTPRKIDLSLKHLSTSFGVGGREKFEHECCDFYDALTIDELKEVCRRKKVSYGKRELAMKRLVIRRSVVAYNLAYLPLPTATTSKGKSKSICSKEVPEDSSTVDSESEEDDEDEE